MSENEYIKKAEKELKYLTEDEETKRLAYLREKAIRDEMAAMAKARREGREEGKIKEKKETARKMLAKHVDIETIMEFTELTKEEIDNL